VPLGESWGAKGTHFGDICFFAGGWSGPHPPVARQRGPFLPNVGKRWPGVAPIPYPFPRRKEPQGKGEFILEGTGRPATPAVRPFTLVGKRIATR
jgi:hypothetical protein